MNERKAAPGAIKVERVNDVKVKPPPGFIPNTQWRGQNIIPVDYPNIFLCARKKSGKTVTIYNMLKKIVGPETIIVAFVPTIRKDKTWRLIRKDIKKRGNAFVSFSSLKDEEGEDRLGGLMKSLRRSKGTDLKDRKGRTYPSFVLIFDDISDELRGKVAKKFTTLLKSNRHWRFTTIVSSQYPNDLSPEQLRQIDLWMVFRGQPPDKIKKIYKDAQVPTTYDQFENLYKYATHEKYNFLWIDSENLTLRRNFDENLSIT